MESPTTAAKESLSTEGQPLDLACKGCGARLSVPPELRASRCPFCEAPWVVDRPETRDRPDPSYALGFVVDGERASELVRAWIRSRSIFAPGRLARSAIERTNGVYVPAYLCSAIANVDWSAQIGEEYTVTETYTSNGKVHTRTVTKTEWRSLAGKFSGWVRDVLVTASKGLPNEELARIEPFDLRGLRRYEPGVISGWLAEEPTLALDACRESAVREAELELRERIAGFLPGDSQRDVQFDARIERDSAELVLVPVWVFAARWSKSKPPMRVLVNGQSGEVQGDVPLSPVRIVGAVVLGLAVLALIVLFLVRVLG